MQSGFISENDASGIAGVSTRTLTRFAEAGYLQVENGSNGIKFYSRREVLELFGIMDQTFYDKLAQDITQPTQTQTQTQSIAKEVEVQKYEAGHTTSTISTAELSSAEAISSRDAEEVTKLRNLMSLQEKILDVKDEQIRSLSQERDWLRERIEKLEQKAERDQLLILSESQTVRRLVIMNHERKSPLRSALEFLGLVTPTTPPTDLKSTIETNLAQEENKQR